MTRRRVARLASVLAVAAGCSTAPPRPLPVPHVPPPPAKSEQLQLFDTVRNLLTAVHVTSPITQARFPLGEDHWNSLRERFRDAADERALHRAIERAVTAFHSSHCRYHPRTPLKSFQTGIFVAVADANETEPFYIGSVQNKALGITRGDVIVSVNGIKADRLAISWRDRVPANSMLGVRYGIADSLSRPAEIDGYDAGSAFELVLRSSGSTSTKKVRVTASPLASPTSTGPAAEANYDYGTGCLGRRAEIYGADFHVVARGVTFCVYRSAASGVSDVAVIRQPTFALAPEVLEKGLRADHSLLSLALADPSIRRVIIDVRENGGGSNPLQFVSWWAEKPFTVPMLRVRLASVRQVEAAIEAPGYIGPPKAELFASTPPGVEWSKPSPWLCPAPYCTGDRMTTLHPVRTGLRLGVLAGPRCESACSTFVRVMHDNGVARIVGQTTAASTAPVRARVPLSTPSLGEIGKVEIVLGELVLGAEGKTLEGNAVEPDPAIPADFESANDGSGVIRKAAAALL